MSHIVPLCNAIKKNAFIRVDSKLDLAHAMLSHNLILFICRKNVVNLPCYNAAIIRCHSMQAASGSAFGSG